MNENNPGGRERKAFRCNTKIREKGGGKKTTGKENPQNPLLGVNLKKEKKLVLSRPAKKKKTGRRARTPSVGWVRAGLQKCPKNGDRKT